MQVYSGAIHVHTDRTGGLPFEEVLAAAHECELDYLVITDARDEEDAKKLRGWHDGVLVMTAQEVVRPDGRFLAFDGRWQEAGENPPGAEESAHRVRLGRGAVAGINYQLVPNGVQPRSYSPPLDPKYADLLEIWSFYDEYVSRVTGETAVQFYSRPERVLHGPPRSMLRRWDDEQRTRQIPAIGCVNARLHKAPLLGWRDYFPYETQFRTIRTAVLTDALPADDERQSRRMVWDALREGHSWIYNESLGDGRDAGFFYIDDEGMTHQIGARLKAGRSGVIEVLMPQDCEVVVRQNGYPLLWATGRTFRFPAPGSGVLRLEAWVDGRAWLFTNAIHIQTEHRYSRETTVADFT